MAQAGVILCLAYILALLCTGLLPASSGWQNYWILASGLGVLGLGIAIMVPRFWRTSPKFGVWLVAVVIGFLTPLYFKFQIPQPGVNDVSKFVSTREGNTQEQLVIIKGEIESTPRLTRSGRSQFQLEASQLNEIRGSNKKPANINQKVTGKLYVTVPLLQATGLHPGQAIAVTGVLYKPKLSDNPGGFNFQRYLAQEGIFAGLKGRQINLPDEVNFRWGWWTIRQWIIRAQVEKLGVPEGPLVSAMVLGNRVVDLPFYLSDSFIRTGLAHALAASGFQVSLILGVVLALTGRFSSKTQFIFGITALLIFLGLTGPQPSVLRAVVMGVGGLVGLVQKRQVKPLGSLLVAATMMLLFNPLWIGDLSFQLSVLATLGLLVTATPLTKKLDWLPPAIAILIAIPISAYLWTLPLQLYAFGVVPPYSILVNVIATIPLSIISIGAFISAIVAVILPAVGSWLAWLLYYPTHWLIAIVEFFASLPGNSVAVGTISILQLLTLYWLIGLVWLSKWWQKRWWVAGLMAIGLVSFPILYTKSTVFQVTVLSTNTEPVLTVQDQGRVTLINSGDDDTVIFTVLPFLQQQGINQVDWAVAINSQPMIKSGWRQILKRLTIKNFYINSIPPKSENSAARKLLIPNSQPLVVGQTVNVGSIPLKLIGTEPTVLQLQIRDRTWLLMGSLKSVEQKKLAADPNLPRTNVLWWSGEKLSSDLLNRLQPEIAIASSATIAPETVEVLQKFQTQYYWTGRDGALQWTPARGFETTLEATDNDGSL